MSFMPKIKPICTSKKAEFNGKNNYMHYKLASFQLNSINKVNFRFLIIMLYTLSELRLRNV